MEKVYIGVIVNTHGIKGEFRIKDDLESTQRKEIFKVSSHIIIDNESYLITSYRRHKDYDMITIDGFNNINDVLKFKGMKVYKDRNEIILGDRDILDSDFINYKVLTTSGKIGIIKSIEKTGINYKILRLIIDNEEILIPYHQDFILNIDQAKKEVLVKLI